MRSLFFIVLLFLFGYADSQTIGGSSVFNFLRLPNSPQLTGLGGINVSNPSADLGMAFNNPSLLSKEMHTQLNAVFNNFYSGVNTYHLSFGYYHEKLKTNFSTGLNYFDYGTINETDASGNLFGLINPRDWVFQLSASRSYLEKWNYGTTLKFISSNYGLYRSNGIAVDVALLYKDSVNLFSASLVVKNMGYQLREYTGSVVEELPFDMQLGITKKLQDAPLSFSITAHRLHQFDLRYNDTVFNSQSGLNEKGKFTADKIFRHFILAAQAYPAPQIEMTAAYNHLRRQELNISNSTNGLNGFSVGVGLVLKKIQVRYARAYYQNNTAYNQLGLNLKLNEYFGLGKFGEKIRW